MNFLGLVNDAMTECGTGQTTALTTVQTASNAEVARFITWVGDAWNEMQIDNPTWEFLRTTVDIQTTANIGAYTLATLNAQILAASQFTTLSPTQPVPANAGIAAFIPKTFRGWHTAQGFPDEQLINYLPWDTFRNIYRYAAMRTTYNRPVIASVDPLKTLNFGPIPDDIYTIEFEIYQLPQILVADADVPMAPVRFHKAITYKVMQKYAAFESAPEVMARGTAEYEKIMGELYQDRLPIIMAGPPLA